MAGEIVFRDMYMAFGGTVLDTKYRTATWDDTANLIDASGGADTRIPWLTGMVDGGMAVTIVLIDGATGGTTQITALEPGNSGTLEWGPEGTASGKPKYTINAVVQSRSVPYNYNDVTVMTAQFKWNDSSGIVSSSY